MYKNYTKKLGALKWRVHKLLLIMRLTTIILIVSLMQVSASSIAQKISLSERNAPINKIFDLISNQTGYDFLVTRTMIKDAKPVNISVENEELDVVLKRIFDEQPLAYVIKNKSVVVSMKKPSFLDRVASVFTNIEVRGHVVDSSGLALRGANVRLKGTSRVLQTDREGSFYFSQVPENAILVVSYLGYTTREIKVSTSVMTVILKSDQKVLDEVTVTNGYQNFDRRNLTSAITTIKAEDILVPGMFTIDQALEGRVPGLFVLNNSGEIGSAPKIRIRGTSTVLGNQEPVWVVDGVVVSDPVRIDPATINDLDFVNRIGNAISGLNPYDIDQIDVLKDASATALYGVKAANGVIVITTKKGHMGPPLIHFSTSGTLMQRSHYSDGNINVMNSLERTNLSKEILDKKLDYPAFINYVGYEGALREMYNGNLNYDAFQQQVHQLETANTNWLGIITENSLSTQNTLSISGGTAKTKYFTSFGLQNQQGTVRGDEIKSYTSLIRVSTNLSDRLIWDVNLRTNIGKRDYVASNVNALNYAYNTNRSISAYNNDGSLYYYKKFGSANYYNFNILNEMENSRDLTNSLGVNLINTVSYRISNDLKASAIFSYGNSSTTQAISYTANTFYAASVRLSDYGVTPIANQTSLPVGGELRNKNDRSSNYLARTQFDYNKSLDAANKHLLSATIGAEMSSMKYDGQSSIRRGYMPDRGKTFAAINPATYPLYAQWALLNNLDVITDQLTNLLSGYFTTSYTYNNKYTINFNTRSDYSNKFGSRSNEKFLPTWSLSGRWNAADDLFKNSEIVNQLSLRGSYGSQGNMLDNQTPDLIIQQGAVDPVSGEPISTIKYTPNPNLKWEKTNQFNGTLDFSLFNNKLNGSVTYYYKKTNDVIIDKALTDVNGYDSFVINSGSLVNRGLEFALSFTPINTALSGGKRLIWRIDPQIGQAINSLITRNPTVATSSANTFTNYLNGSAIINSHALNSFYSYQFSGLSGVNGMPVFKNDDNTPANIAYINSLTRDQLLQYVLVPSGRRIPDIQGGLSNYVAYKSFSLSFNLSYSFGAKVRKLKLFESLSGEAKGYGTSVPVPEQNVSTEFLNRWRNPGDENSTKIPGFLTGIDYNTTVQHFSSYQSYNYAVNIWQMYDNSDLRVVSGSFVKVKSMSFNYNVPDQVCKRLGIKNASLNLSGTNLYTFASKELNGQDPEQAGFSTSIQPSSRPTYSFGIDISF